MKIAVFALCVAAVCAQRDSFGSSGDRFDPSGSRDRFPATSGNSDRGRDTNRDRDRDTVGSGSGDRFPPFFRVEVEIQRLENKNGFRSDGKACDLTSDCDPRISAYLDDDKPLSPWPGSKPVKDWATIFEATDNNSPTIGKSVNRDVCGGSISKVNLRVNVVDVDSTVGNDLIGTFECLFTVSPRDIATSAGNAQWGPSMECVGATQQGKIKLFARLRGYEIASSSCQAVAGSGMNTDSLVNGPSAKREGEHDFIRVDVELVQLLNPQGVTNKKVKCDTGNACDPSVYAYLDTDKPLAAWPGSRTVDKYELLFSTNNVDSPVINKNLGKNICGGSVSQINLRAHVVDSDVTTNDDIEDFECVFAADYRKVARDVSSADWSSTQDCKPLHPGHDIRLQYRYRLYDILPAACGIKPAGSKPAASGGFLSNIFG